jgi:hypothetical protein
VLSAGFDENLLTELDSLSVFISVPAGTFAQASACVAIESPPPDVNPQLTQTADTPEESPPEESPPEESQTKKGK